MGVAIVLEWLGSQKKPIHTQIGPVVSLARVEATSWVRGDYFVFLSVVVVCNTLISRVKIKVAWRWKWFIRTAWMAGLPPAAQKRIAGSGIGA